MGRAIMRRPIFFLILAAVLGLTPAVHAEDGVKLLESKTSNKPVELRVDRNTPGNLPAKFPPGTPTPAAEKIIGPVPLPNRETNPVVTAGDFLALYGKVLGPQNAAKELKLSRIEKDERGISHIRYTQQTADGLPILGAEVVVHVAPDGAVLGANGSLAKFPARMTSPISRGDPSSQAKAKLAALNEFYRKHPKLKPTVANISQWVVQPSLLENTKDLAVYRTWDVHITADEGRVDEEYFVDAATYQLVLWLDNVRKLNRKVWDCSSKPGTNICSSNTELSWDNQWQHWVPPPDTYIFGNIENGSYPHGPNPRYPLPERSTDTDDLFVALADIHSFYQTVFGRDGANGQGGNADGSYSGIPINTDGGVTYANYITTWECPNAIAFKNQGAYFCKGLILPDIIGHEYAHAVNWLTYSGESGAVNESNSDLMGEFFEAWKAGGAPPDWINGGNTQASWKRNLFNPPAFVDPDVGLPYPDRYTSSNVYCGSFDSGGLHHNSTILSKAFYLLSQTPDPENPQPISFNGCEIIGIGIDKAQQILFHANLQYFSGAENFNRAYNEIIQACVDLYGTGSFECIQVVRALQSVEMDQVGYCADPGHLQTHAATCQCTDTDDWRGDGSNYASQGWIPGSVTVGSDTYIDHCDGALTEFYCDRGVMKSVTPACVCTHDREGKGYCTGPLQ
jgi:bacillolysin